MKKCYAPLLFLFLQVVVLSAQSPTSCTTDQFPGANACADACLHCFLNGRTGSTIGYTASPAPGFCGTVENDAWFGFVAGADSIVIEVTPSNCQSGDGIEIALYQNCADAPIACAAGLPGEGNVPRNLTAGLTPGQTYFLMVDGTNGDQCSFQITTEPAGAVALPPVDPVEPVEGPVLVAPASVLQYQVAAVPGATAYRWTGPASIRINGSTPPVTIPAPDGNQVTITFGSEGGALCVAPLFACSPGLDTCLYFVIGSEFLIPPCPSNDFPAADLCIDACVLCNFNGYTGSTAGYSGQTAGGFCGTIENEQWIAFTAGASAATFTATPSNCQNGDGIQLALYASCDAEGPIACNEGASGSGDIPVSVTASLVPGQMYYLLIDGHAGDICDYQLSVVPPNAAIAPPIGSTGQIQGPANVCPGSTLNYSVAASAGAIAYTWVGPPGSMINGLPSPVTLVGAGSNIVQITFGMTSGQVCVQPLNSCYTGTMGCKQITVTPIPVTNLPPVTICAEEAPYYTPWGHPCPTPGTYCFTYTTALGCDSIVCQQVNIRAPITFIYAPQFLCTGDSIVVCGQSFSTVGNHTKICESYQGCDSTVHLTIVALLEPVAQIDPGTPVTCSVAPIELNSAPSPGVKTWTTLNGDVVGIGNSTTVSSSGVYILTTTVTAGGKSCTASDTITVQFEAAIPGVQASGGIITCAQPSVQLNAVIDPPGLGIAWSGPNGFFSDLEDPVVNQPGTYVLEVTDTVSGCTVQATVLVLSDQVAPIVSISGPVTINCTNPEILLSCPPVPSGITCVWSGPGITIPGPNPLVDSSGVYLLTTTGANGCTSTAELTVNADFQIPVITAYADTITCLNSTTTIHCEVDIPLSVCDWSGVGPTYFVTATAPNGCTSTATVDVPVNAAAPAISVSDDTIRCDSPAAMLFANTNVSGALFAWTGPGGFSSSEQSLTVTEAGVYFVTVTDPENGCTSSAMATVFADQGLPPIFIAQPNVLTCAMPVVVLSGMSNSPTVEFLWTGPNGFSSTEPEPEVSEPGIYMLVVTNPATGCSSNMTIVVQQNIQLPGATASANGILTCTDLALQLSGISPAPNATYLWTGPSIITPGVNPVVDEPGIYTLVVTDPTNGCTSTATATVLQNIEPPIVTLMHVTNDQGGQGIGAISISVSHVIPYSVAWYRDGQFFSDQENISGLTAGEYTVVVTGFNGCTDSLVVPVTDIGVSAPEISNENLWLVFPNPANGQLYLRYLGPDQPEAQVFLLDATGRAVLEQRAPASPKILLPCGNLPAGIYTVLIRTRDTVVRRLVAVQR